jgi:CDP-2,3-bis-(O-geranylgeranyl)-sn-glycerol synthase
MNVGAVPQLLILLAIANSVPIAAKRLLHDRFSYPLDGGLVFFDGRPLFGPSKTIRGILVAVLVTSVCAPLIGLEWETGALIASVSMVGDLFSSFLKRRMKLPSSGKATGLDQVPESLFPAIACRNLLSLSVVDILVCVVVFFICEVILARLFYRLHFRDRPY